MRKSTFATPFAISLGLHFMMLATATLIFGKPKSFPEEERLQAVRVKMAEPSLNSNQDISGQVVDILNKNESSTSPKDSKFLSDRNRTVEKETQARSTGLLSNPGGGSQRPETKKGEGFDLSVPKEILSKLSGHGGGGGSGERTAAMAPSNYLPEIAFGEETLLSTREYVFASFFVRMKRQIESYWHPLQWIRRMSEEELVTSVTIRLRADGYVEEVRVVEPSGIPRLDQEAVQAVQLGGPFLNPPQALTSDDGG